MIFYVYETIERGFNKLNQKRGSTLQCNRWFKIEPEDHVCFQILSITSLVDSTGKVSIFSIRSSIICGPSRECMLLTVLLSRTGCFALNTFGAFDTVQLHFVVESLVRLSSGFGFG